MTTRRFISIVFACLLCSLPHGSLDAQELGADGDVASPFAVTPAEQERLLDKVEQTLVWFRSLSRESRADTPPARFRAHLTPMELMQAAAILQSRKQPDMSRLVREMLPYFQITPDECFEIEERLEKDMLASFQDTKENLPGDAVDSTTRIRQGAELFLKEFLRPSERMALYHPPETVAELMKAVDLLAVSGRPVLVRYYLRRFLDAGAEPEEYAKIVDRVGSRRLMAIAGNGHFAPQGAEAVAKIFAEAKTYWQAPETVSDAVERWRRSEADERLKPERSESLRAIGRGGTVSVMRLIETLGETDDEKEADEIVAVLLSLGDDVKEALAESLCSDNPKLIGHAARGLASAISPEEVFLLYPVLYSKKPAVSEELRNQVERNVLRIARRKPTRDGAVATLYRRARDYFERNRPLKTDPDGQVRFWNWSDTENALEYVSMLLPAAYRSYAYRYATQACEIVSPDVPEFETVRRFYLTTLFERGAYLNGRDKPFDPNETGLQAVLDRIDATELERMLVESLEKEYYGAAQVAATLLGRSGQAAKLLNSHDGKPRPLVRATVAPDRRVRYAALEAIMSLKPENPYPGSSLVSETLIWFSRADGRKVLVSAHPKQSIAARIAGYFISCGYKGELAVTSRDAMRLAADSPDVELLVVNRKCSQPSVPNLVQAMRADYRTHEIPIAVMSDRPDVLATGPNVQALPAMQRIDRLSPDNPFAVSLSQIYPEIADNAAAQWIEADLLEKTGADPVPGPIRLEQARRALGWIEAVVRASGNGPKIYHFEELEDAVSRALRSDVRIEAGMKLAAAVPAAAMQAALYEIVADSVYPMELRQKAGGHFKRSIEEFGVLLRGNQVRRLYDRYNAGEFEPKETQELLSKMIDVIENKTLK